ncbi:MAG: GIY-YIG nuclease family protein [Phycisphaerae bacterium]
MGAAQDSGRDGTQVVMKSYYVYIMGSQTGTLYVGMTNNIKQRVYQHRKHLKEGFTDKYNVNRLLYVETLSDALSAISREKQIKKWRREKKIELIDSQNPSWSDLSLGWYEDAI